MDTGGLIIQPLKKSKHFLKCYKNRITELPYLLKRGYCLMGFFHTVIASGTRKKAHPRGLSWQNSCPVDQIP
jgi:hypothetical protein